MLEKRARGALGQLKASSMLLNFHNNIQFFVGRAGIMASTIKIASGCRRGTQIRNKPLRPQIRKRWTISVRLE